MPLSSASVVPYSIKQGSLEPDLQVTLTQAAGPIPLALATSITILATQIDGRKVITGECYIIDPDAGTIGYVWQPGDTDTPGLYQLSFTINFGSRPRTVPNSGWEGLEVVALS